MISPFEMAQIYWRWLKAQSLWEINERINHSSPIARPYWNEVLHHITVKRQGKGRLN